MTEFSPQDTAHMRRALDLATQGRFSTSPNPRVGCVIARGGQIVGQGFHLQAGTPHAEVHALRQAGGRTPPCAEALIAGGVGRVVAAMRDPNPQVAGKGFALLEAAGIATACGLLADEARELNRGFLSRIERGRPFVRIKTAASLDGKTALADGRSQWITGAAARADVQRLRAESCAVLTGIGTVLADDPQLNVRDFPTLRQPLRIVLDSRLRLSPAHRIAGDGGATLVITLVPDDGRFAVCPAVRVRTLPDDGSGRIHLAALLELLAAEEQIGELMVEAGATLAGEFLRQDLADEIVHYQAPKILGSDARNLFRLPENPAALSGSGIWHSRSVEMLGSDIKWTLRRA